MNPTLAVAPHFHLGAGADWAARLLVANGRDRKSVV